MRYYGAKNKLLSFIEGVVSSTELNSSSKFVDLFAGTCSVGKHFKKLGFTVISNDILEFSFALSKTYIELNKEPQFKKLKAFLKIKDNTNIIDYLNKTKDYRKDFIYNNYSPFGGRKYFSEINASKIDTFRYLVEEWKNRDKINQLEYYYLITAILKAVNLVSNVSGTYAAYLKTWDPRALKEIFLQPVDIILSPNKNKAFKEDANVIINRLKPDILYLDPPYNSRQYASNYFILELIANGWYYEDPLIYGKTGMVEYSHLKSKYSSKAEALNSLEDLIRKAKKSKHIILSYNNEGIIEISDIERTLSSLGKIELFTENHKRYRSTNQTVEDANITQEYLFYVAPKKTTNITNSLSGKEWLQNSFSIWRDLVKNDEERKLKHPATFSLKLVSKIIDTFCKPNGGLVLDCFAGSGSTLIAGLLKNKDVIGVDLNKNYKDLFIKRALYNYNIPDNGLRNKYLVEDSRKLSLLIEPNSVDLCITSPPYWDILNRLRTADNKTNISYSDSSNDIGNVGDYEEFLNSLLDIINEVNIVLKPKCYFILNVMDLRKKDKFFPLHIDIINKMKDSNFSLEDIIIWDRQIDYNNMKPLGYPFKFIINKVHEYLLIFRKYEYDTTRNRSSSKVFERS